MKDKTGFSTPIAPEKIKPEYKPKDGKNSPWNFEAPEYDERSSCYVNAGTNYGTGKAQPIGHSGNAKLNVDVLPHGRVNTMNYTKN